MQENNTEKRIIRGMKRTFHGHRIKKKKKTGYIMLDLKKSPSVLGCFFYF